MPSPPRVQHVPKTSKYLPARAARCSRQRLKVRVDEREHDPGRARAALHVRWHRARSASECENVCPVASTSQMLAARAMKACRTRRRETRVEAAAAARKTRPTSRAQGGIDQVSCSSREMSGPKRTAGEATAGNQRPQRVGPGRAHRRRSRTTRAHARATRRARAERRAWSAREWRPRGVPAVVFDRAHPARPRRSRCACRSRTVQPGDAQGVDCAPSSMTGCRAQDQTAAPIGERAELVRSCRARRSEPSTKASKMSGQRVAQQGLRLSPPPRLAAYSEAASRPPNTRSTPSFTGCRGRPSSPRSTR